MNKNVPCEWCVSTSNQIDSIDYDNEQLKAALKEIGATCIRADARSSEDYLKLPTRHFDLIIECAAQPSACAGLENPFFDFTNNTLAVMHVLEIARRNKTPVIFFSTNKIYAEICNTPKVVEKKTRFAWKGGQRFTGFDSHYGFNEDIPTDGKEHSIYGASKLQPSILFVSIPRHLEYQLLRIPFLAWLRSINMDMPDKVF